MGKVIACGVALIRRDREFLIAQRKPEDSFGSFWEFPGGKKNTDESFEECVAREAREELGIEVAVEEKFMEIRRRHHKHIIWLNFYVCSYVSGEPRPLECQKVLWVDLDELKRFKFPPANDRVIEKLIRNYAHASA
jgi:A/G-specific adenine glycosylase